MYRDRYIVMPPLSNANNNSRMSLNRDISSYEEKSYTTSLDQRRAAFQRFIKLHKINSNYASKLRRLEGREIVFICDDSSSMALSLNDVVGEYKESPTRWDELQHTLSIVVDLAVTLDSDGVDIYFLNREPMHHVRSSEELIPMFAVPPEGTTPIVRVFREVLVEKRQEIEQGRLLIYLVTDGEPTDADGIPQPHQLREFLLNERRAQYTIPVTIIACTDDKNSMSYLNKWDKTIPNLDVVDDFQSEKKEILACQGNDFPFSYGDYITKVLLGCIDPWFDQLDEQKVSLEDFHP